jgi:hypothetical protein
MEKGRTGTMCDVLDPALSLAVLMVRIDSTESQTLLSLNASVLENFGIKQSVVSMVMADVDPTLEASALKS